MSTQSQIFFITGVSTGFGRELAIAALAEGHTVVGTLRNDKALAEFEALKPGKAIGRILDVTHEAEIVPTIDAVEREVGPIGVLVNNAGFGHEGLLEESTMEEIRYQFDVNVFGAVALMKAVLPHMRRRRRGRILNITSMGGLATFPGISVYNGSKFALEGFSESVGKEVKSFGIHVTAVEPGGFRTDWAGRSMVRVERSIADYDAVFEPLRARRLAYNGNQAGDPKKAAHVMLRLVENDNPPAHLLLGTDAIRLVGEKLDTITKEFEAWKDVSASTDFDS